MFRAIRFVPGAALIGVACNYAAFLSGRAPFTVDRLAEWIMARTPSWMAVALLERLGPWAKPFAATGALALLGFSMLPAALIFAAAIPGWLCAAISATGMTTLLWLCGSNSWLTFTTLALPAAIAFAALATRAPRPVYLERRRILSGAGASMLAGVLLVAGEAYTREWARRKKAPVPHQLFPFHIPENPAYPATLVRKAATPVNEFYVMSKNTVDPAIDARHWRLRISVDGRTAHEYDYSTLVARSSQQFYATLRCISNTLKSDLMGTALWTGFPLDAIASKTDLPPDTIEAAFIGSDGHGDSFPLDYVFSKGVILATGMNGKTLDRLHGFPLRLVAPRYYGFKNIKWLREIDFVRKPYVGTWPAMGWSKQAFVHTASHIDRIQLRGGEIAVGGVSFAGDRGVSRVCVRIDGSEWHDAVLERPLSPYCWTRWAVTLPASRGAVVEARACDGHGQWQAATAKPMFPDGVAGPTRKSI